MWRPYDWVVPQVSLRPAVADDAAFLAFAMQEADRGHTGIGSLDLLLPGPDAQRLATIARLAGASHRSSFHWSTFRVAEFDGRLVGTIAGFVPDEMPPATFQDACAEVLGPHASKVLSRTHAWSSSYFSVALPGDTLRVEWVYTDPALRGRGISTRLLSALLDDARRNGHAEAHVVTYLGNEPAIATYRRCGFEPFAECRHADFETQFGSPGLLFLRRAT
jgi:GNAT superfamily N-acetyltransferase